MKYANIIVSLQRFKRKPYGINSFGKAIRKGGRVVEGARLESVCTPKGYPGFESLFLRSHNEVKIATTCKTSNCDFYFNKKMLWFC